MTEQHSIRHYCGRNFSWWYSYEITLMIVFQISNFIMIFNDEQRSCSLFLLGLVLNSLGGYNSLEQLRVTGVLQRFAVSYLVVSLLGLACSPKDIAAPAGSVTNFSSVWLFLLLPLLCHCHRCELVCRANGGSPVKILSSWCLSGSSWRCWLPPTVSLLFYCPWKIARRNNDENNNRHVQTLTWCSYYSNYSTEAISDPAACTTTPNGRPSASVERPVTSIAGY